MHGSATPLLYNACSIIRFTNAKTTTFCTTNHRTPGTPSFFSQGRRKVSACRSGSESSQQFPITEFNLYELLGVEASSDRRQIKEAYRALQKRCHPDIAGPPGHDMAIVLNEAYALLCDPNARMAYDKELAKLSDFQGYTGRPIYSVWIGSESEERAIFVDEVKCVGCLKCALFADKTFAVESVYGRARVVAQWADPEHKIQEAIAACPVDCISIVERSELAALEFIMSKQPRGNVRIGAGNTAGVRTADVFDEVEKFKARYAQHKDSKNYSKETEAHRASRVSAIQAIQMISNWLYWQSPSTDATSPATQHSKPGQRRHAGPSLKKLKAAAAARKQRTTSSQPRNTTEYWVPSAVALPDATTTSGPSLQPRVDSTTMRKKNKPNSDELLSHKDGSPNPLTCGVPIGTSIVAAVVVWLQLGEAVGGGLDGHIGGPLALAIVNSPWMQVVLAGVAWYLVGMYVVELVEALRRK